MISFRTLVALTVIVLAAAGISGCDGGGGTGNSLTPYLGRWMGPFTATVTGQAGQETGTVDLTVLTNGDFIGTMANTTTGATGTLGGEVDVDDDVIHVNGTIAYPGSVPFTIAGTLQITNNHLTGNIYTYDSQRQLQATAAVDLARP